MQIGLTCNLISVLMADEFEQAFRDVDENNFLIFLLFSEARLNRLSEVLHALNRLATLITIFIENRIDISLWLCLLNLLLKSREVDEIGDACQRVLSGLLNEQKK